MPITNFDKVELLLPMTGANNGTVFTDYSLRRRAVTRVGAVTSTAQSKFGAYGSSGLFNGTSAYLSIPYGAIGTVNWCFEGYVRITSLGTANQCIFGKVTNGNSVANGLLITAIRSNHPDNPRGILVNGASAVLLGSGVIQDATWYHLAVSNDAGITRVFVDGSKVGSDASISHNITDTANIDVAAQIGSSPPTRSNFFGGHMQDVCVTIGSAKYTANFTPPARMTQRTLTRASTGTDSHEYDRAVLFDWDAPGESVVKSVVPDSEGDFVASDLIDLEYGVAFIRDGCSPVCRGPVEVDAD
jgi:hypothetical protein